MFKIFSTYVGIALNYKQKPNINISDLFAYVWSLSDIKNMFSISLYMTLWRVTMIGSQKAEGYNVYIHNSVAKTSKINVLRTSYKCIEKNESTHAGYKICD